MKKLLILITLSIVISFSQAVFAEDNLVTDFNVIDWECGRMNDWISQAPDTDLDKALAAYTYICLQYKYDYIRLQGGKPGMDTKRVIMERAAICSDYAKLLNMASDCAGTESELVGVYIEETGSGHAWNVMKVDGKWYFADSTWDGGDDEPGRMQFDYFLKSASGFNNHDPYNDSTFENYKQKCTSTEFDNYWWNDETDDGLAYECAPIPYKGNWYYVQRDGDIVKRSSAYKGAEVSLVRKDGTNGIYHGNHLVIKGDKLYFMGGSEKAEEQYPSIYSMSLNKNEAAEIVFTPQNPFGYFGTIDGMMYYNIDKTSNFTYNVVIPGVNVPVTEVVITPPDTSEIDLSEPVQLDYTVYPENATDKTVIFDVRNGCVTEDGKWRAKTSGTSVIRAFAPGGNNKYREVKIDVPKGDCGQVPPYPNYMKDENGRRKLWWKPAEGADRYSVFAERSTKNMPQMTYSVWLGDTDKNIFDVGSINEAEYKDLSVVPADQKGIGIGTENQPTAKTYTLDTPENIRIVQQNGSEVKITCDPVQGAGHYSVGTLDPSDWSWHTSLSSVSTSEEPELTICDLEKDKTYYFFISAYNDGENSYQAMRPFKLIDIPAESITLSEDDILLYKSNNLENSKKLSVIYTPFNATDRGNLVWSSDDSGVASVDNNGLVQAVGGGSTKIKATLGGLTAECTVTVNVPVSSVFISSPPDSITAGESVKINATIYPDNATNKNIIWESSDESVAKVSKDGTMTGLSKGRVKITATAADENCTGTRTYSFYCDVDTDLTGIALPDSVKMKYGESLKDIVIYLPEDSCDRRIPNFSSSNEEVIKIASDGIPVAVGIGKATVSAWIYNLCSVSTIVEVEKADPKYTVPSDITAECGTTLSEISLPEGFAWDDPSAVVNPNGSLTFSASYTPQDTEHYNTANNINISVAVTHSWGAASYSWSDDNSKCTATRSCTRNGCNVTDSKEAESTSDTTDPTCTEAGKIIYTARFTEEGLETQTKETAGEAKLGHNWGAASYSWSDDNSKCTATRSCTREGCNKTDSEEVSSTSVTTPPTTAEDGRITYTAAFTHKGLEVQTKTVAVPKLPEEEKPVVTVTNGMTADADGGTYRVVSDGKKTIAFTKAKNVKDVTVPDTVKINGKTFKVTQVNKKAFTGKNIRNVTVGRNVSKLASGAFMGSKATTVTVKTKALKKANVKGCLKGSKVKTIKVSISKKQNSKYVKSYKRIFTKKNAGRMVTVK